MAQISYYIVPCFYSHPKGIQTVMADEVFDLDSSSDVDAQSVDDGGSDQDANISGLGEISKCHTFITYESCVRQLIDQVPAPTRCGSANCSAAPRVSMKTVGTALSVKWVCHLQYVKLQVL